MPKITPILLYIGFGFAIQVVGYGDTTFQSLFSLDANLSTWAHILAWPLFLLLMCGYYFLWFLGACVLLGLGCVAYVFIYDILDARHRAAVRLKRRT